MSAPFFCPLLLRPGLLRSRQAREPWREAQPAPLQKSFMGTARVLPHPPLLSLTHVCSQVRTRDRKGLMYDSMRAAKDLRVNLSYGKARAAQI